MEIARRQVVRWVVVSHAFFLFTSVVLSPFSLPRMLVPSLPLSFCFFFSFSFFKFFFIYSLRKVLLQNVVITQWNASLRTVGTSWRKTNRNFQIWHCFWSFSQAKMATTLHGAPTTALAFFCDNWNLLQVQRNHHLRRQKSSLTQQATSFWLIYTTAFVPTSGWLGKRISAVLPYVDYRASRSSWQMGKEFVIGFESARG